MDRKEREVKQFWLVDGHSWEGYRLSHDGVMRLHFDDAPYDDCDFEGLSGLLVMEGTLEERPEPYQALDESAPDYWEHGANYAEWYNVTWRHATVEEAQSLLGLLLAPTEATP